MSDFALNHFKDLRNLLFWHGASIMHKHTTFMIICVSKTTVFGLALLFFNTQSMYSSTNFSPSLLFTNYSLFLAQIGYYNFFDQPISRNRFFFNEEKMKYSLAEHYRLNLKRSYKDWPTNFFLQMLYTYYAGIIAVFVGFWTMGNMLDSEGNILDFH